MLNAATIIINVSIINITFLSTSKAENNCACLLVQGTMVLPCSILSNFFLKL